MTEYQNKRFHFHGVSGSTLKVFAILIMLIDHMTVGLYLPLIRGGYISAWTSLSLTQQAALYTILRNVGRSAFPIFCFLLIEGYEHTHSKWGYLRNMILFALISDIPFDLGIISDTTYPVFDFAYMQALTDPIENLIWFYEDNPNLMMYQNVYMTLAIGLAVIWAMDTLEKKITSRIPAKIAAIIPLACGCALAEVLHTDYGMHGVMLIFIMFFLRELRPAACMGGYGYISVALHEGGEQWAFPGFLMLLIYNGKRGFVTKSFKYFFYAFYPAHLLLIYILRIMIMGRGVSF